MLESRNISATLSGETQRVSTGRSALSSDVEQQILFGGSKIMATIQ
jgi:hypothetical protein